MHDDERSFEFLKGALLYKDQPKIIEDNINVVQKSLIDYNVAKTHMKCGKCTNNENGKCVAFDTKISLATYITCLEYNLDLEEAK